MSSLPFWYEFVTPLLSCSVSREVVEIGLFSCLCLKGQSGLFSINCHIYAMTENCSAILQVLAANGFDDDRKFALTLQQFCRYVSVLKICKLNTNFA